MAIPLLPHPAEALILARVPQDVRERATRLRLMIFDVDGVLTDGRLYYGEHGETMKRFHALDGFGLRMLHESGIEVVFMTGRDSPSVSRRAAELGISEVQQGVRDKSAAVTALAQRCNVELDDVGFMGDDIIDLAAMQRVGFAASVSEAPVYVTQAAHWVATRPAGDGAARECCDLILAAQGRLGGYITSRTRTTITAGSSPQ
ncbi:HAD hydrolase family protein [Pigmentiphaga sp.]|uniref:KdsC family phosphatase n=1 Tax=Pigmentiphaga sp. TaxID=1977564 RepID=UPI00128E4FDB|nr:HAD hydrolase family protein [Pigmentiphaga sp.]MPS27239.1 phenylphosphate carboxylase subunit delta [Alcaligenaceae bacterium SAGV5]MPS51617.1 phenylphosphate carboxylase subunit delta [Alcaligenaceae bacterium SAGV3]MPT55517.1 phenylphosphate carboxylase subunit delta [Alcaligenaceae bacterium]